MSGIFLIIESANLIAEWHSHIILEAALFVKVLLSMGAGIDLAALFEFIFKDVAYMGSRQLNKNC